MTSVAAAVFADVAAPQQSTTAAKPEPGLFGAALQQAQAGVDPGQAVVEAAAIGDQPDGDPAALANLLVFRQRPSVAGPEQPDPTTPVSAALAADAAVEEGEVTAMPPGVMPFPQQPAPPRLPAERLEPLGGLEPARLPGVIVVGDTLQEPTLPGRLPVAPLPAQPGLADGQAPPVVTEGDPGRMPWASVSDGATGEQAAPGAVLPLVAGLGKPVQGRREPGLPNAAVDKPVEGMADGPARLPVSQLRDILQAPGATPQSQPSRLPAEVMAEVGTEVMPEVTTKGEDPVTGTGPNSALWAPGRASDTVAPASAEPARLPAEPLNHTRLAGEVHSMVLTGQNEARLNLEPADLGQVVVRLLLEDGRVAIDLQSVHAEAREALETALPGLRSALEQQGLRVEGISVSAETSGWNGASSGQNAFQQWQGQQRAPWWPNGQRLGGYPEPARELALAGHQGPSTQVTSTGGIDYRA